jgi:plasmid stabilization system protein ParE
VRLRFTPRALAELDEVLAYIIERSPNGARRVQTRIKVLSDLLLEHPNAGQRTSLKGLAASRRRLIRILSITN